MRAFSLYIFSIFFLLCLTTERTFATTSEGKFVVIIDPGHGGTDTGTPRRKQKMNEKEIALKIATRLGNQIKENYKDVKVVYTRSTDKTLALPSRTSIAKEHKGDLFISIHVNGCPDATARGVETYVFGVTGTQSKDAAEKQRIRERMEDERENIDISGRQVNFDTDIDLETKILCQTQREKHNKYSREFADLVQNNLISQLRRTSFSKNVIDRGVKAKNLFVLCYSPMPSVLVEVGYMSNAKEEAFMNTDEALKAYATALYKSFTTYKSNWDKRQITGKPEEKPAPAPEAKPETKPVTQPAAAPETKPEKKPQAKPEAKPAAQPAAKEEPKPVATKKDIWYSIQFYISPTILPKGHQKLKGLTGYSYYQDGKYYKYTYGRARTTAGLKNDLAKVKKLFPDAFIITVDSEGKRIK